MKFLAIETSCDDTSIAIFEDNHLLSLKTKSQNIHEKYGGIVPEMASREHSNDIDSLIELALKEANIVLKDLNAIVVTQGPGLINSLQIGLVVAKTLALILKIDLYVINHLEGHIYSPFVNKPFSDVPEKAIVLLVSGGHTMLIKKHGFDYDIISQTRDDSIGESFDKVARILKLGFPGGKVIDQIYQDFDQSIEVPKINVSLKKSLDFSYSGLKSNVLKLSNESKYSPQAIAYSFMQVAIEQLILKTENALKKYNSSKLIIVGGVSANSLLRKSFDKNRIKVYLPELQYTTDNAAMIGAAFYFKFQNNLIKPSPLNADSLPKLKLK